MRLILPVLLAVVGTGAGVGAGLMLKPAVDPAAEHDAAKSDPAGGHDTKEAADHGAAPPSDGHGEAASDYVKLSNQFVVPVVEGGRVASMVILSLSIEVQQGGSEGVYGREPKLRDALLQVLFDHANAGGFAGSFTDGANLVILRKALREAAIRVLGATVTDVLISDIVRQDS